MAESSEHILIVDDESSIREVCQRTLQTLGLRVDSAASADEALPLLGRDAYDLVLTDLTMPGSLDGKALLAEIKQRSPETDVIIMTGFPELKTAIPTLKQGAFDYLIKPFDQPFLLSVVSHCLEKRRLSAELDREKKLRRELEAAYAQLQEMERLKEGFIARVNHELRIPLTPLFLALDQLRTLVPVPKGSALCALFEERLRRLQEVIEQVLLFADLRGRQDCVKESVNVRELLQRAVDRYRTLWEEKRIVVEMQWDPGTELLPLNPELMDTVFKSLFLNAIQFNRQNGKIQVHARRLPAAVEIAFRDTGAGIPEEKLSRIFDSFYQAADYLTRHVGGLGLGLAVVRRAVELHGGSIRVESRLNEGSVFRLVLPLEQILAAA